MPIEVFDQLSDRARAGDPDAESALLAALRVRFHTIAKRRVRQDDLEDVVQDALQIVHAKYRDRQHRSGMLAWGLLVLRNVIGNYYQKRERLDREEPLEERADGSAAALHAPSFGTDPAVQPRAVDEVLEAVAALARSDPRCGTIFQRILESVAEGGSPREISSRAMGHLRIDLPDLSRGSLYVALHRCRNRLRDLLQRA